MLLSFRCSDYFVQVLLMSRTIVFYKVKPKAPHQIHSIRSSCFIKKSAFNVAGNLVMVEKFMFQSVFGNSHQIQDTSARDVARSHLSCILSFDLIDQHQNKRFYNTEIVLLLGFADTIFWRERSDDLKCVCCSQATSIYSPVMLHLSPSPRILNEKPWF